MAIPIALITGLVAAGTAIYGAIKSGSDSKKARKQQEMQNNLNNAAERWRYEQQLKESEARWNKENQYNSPQNTMNLYRQAGLNPHLIYGKGSDATAASLSTPQYNHTDRNPLNQYANIMPQLQQASGAIGQMYDLKAKQAQIDNVNQNTALQQQEILFKQASTAKTVQDTAKTDFDLKQAQELKDSVVEQAKLNNEKTKADTIYTTDENQRKALSSTQDVKLTIEKILTEKIAHAKDQSQIEVLKAQLSAIQQETNIKTYEQDLTKMGIHRNDPWYFRAIMNLSNGNMSVPSTINNIPKIWERAKELHKNQKGSGAGSSW